MMSLFRKSWQFVVVLLVVVPCFSLIALSCAHKPAAATGTPKLFFPPPPEQPRVQFLGSISSPADLPKQQSKFAEFVMGPEKPKTQLLKPSNAVLHGTRLYITDTIINSVFVYDLATGENHVLAGDQASGKIKQPNNISIDETGRIYVADKIRQAVLVYGPNEEFQTAIGHPGQAEPVAAVVSGDNLYVVDIKDNEVEVWDRNSGQFLRSWGGHGNAPGTFHWPTQITVDIQGNIYITDTGNARVQKFSSGGQFLMQLGSLGTGLGQFAWPKGMDVDRAGRVYVTDSRFCNTQIFDQQGRLLLFFGGPGPGQGNFDLPSGLFVCPWPMNIPWLQDRVAGGFVAEHLLIAVSQKGAGFINFFAVGHSATESS